MGRFGAAPPTKKKLAIMVAERKETHYSVLSVPPSATQEALRERYLELAAACHPDKATRAQRDDHDKYCQNEKHELCIVCQTIIKFAQITGAYTILKDAKRRRIYDGQLKLAGTQCKTCKGQGTIDHVGFKAAKKREKLCPMCEGTGQALTQMGVL